MDKVSVTKNALFSFYFIKVLFLIRDSYMSWNLRFVSLKVWVGFSIFNSVLFLLKSIFLFNKKAWTLWLQEVITLQTHYVHSTLKTRVVFVGYSFQNYNKGKATHTFGPRPLIFKLQQEDLKFNDVSVSWNSPKTDVETNFLNLENQSF